MGAASIRPAAARDVPAVHGLIRELADYERLTALCTGTGDELAASLAADRPAAEVLVAEADGEIARRRATAVVEDAPKARQPGRTRGERPCATRAR